MGYDNALIDGIVRKVIWYNLTPWTPYASVNWKSSENENGVG